MIRPVFDWLFPVRSLTGVEGEWMTAAELASIRVAPVVVDGRALGLRALGRIVGATRLARSPLLRRAVHLLKYRRVRALAVPLGTLLVDASRVLPAEPTPVLCPVPLHWSRRFWRGFNQCELLACELSQKTGWPACRILYRVRSTGAQVGRARAERLSSVRRAFSVCKGVDVPERVLLVDDVFTTGATLDACAEALKNSGVRIVEAIVLAVD